MQNNFVQRKREIPINNRKFFITVIILQKEGIIQQKEGHDKHSKDFQES